MTTRPSHSTARAAPRSTAASSTRTPSSPTSATAQTFAQPFKLIVTYNSGTAKFFVHIWTDQTGEHQETINACAKNNPSYPCFLTSGKTFTLLMRHNGGVRRG